MVSQSITPSCIRTRYLVCVTVTHRPTVPTAALTVRHGRRCSEAIDRLWVWPSRILSLFLSLSSIKVSLLRSLPLAIMIVLVTSSPLRFDSQKVHHYQVAPSCYKHSFVMIILIDISVAPGLIASWLSSRSNQSQIAEKVKPKVHELLWPSSLSQTKGSEPKGRSKHLRYSQVTCLADPYPSHPYPSSSLPVIFQCPLRI